MTRRILALITAPLLAVAPAVAQHTHHAPDSALPALDRQINAARRATERYREHANAVSDGYRLFGAEGPLMGEHWYHPDLVRKPLDLEHPATLQYALIDGRRTLVGVAYNTYQKPGQPLPDGFAGTTDHWHVHDMPKLARALVADRPLLRRIVDRRVERGELGAGDFRSQLVMVHAWIWSDNPAGMFAQQHRALPYLRAGLPSAWAGRADLNAAQGVALLREGCAQEIGRLDRLARLSAEQQKSFKSACDTAASKVRAAAAHVSDADALNTVAAGAWKTFSQQRDGLLTSDQKRRLAAVVEPMHPV
ncbi:MAG: hypothetical protein ACREMA_09750, partial [Longimicrobiales bacterium]